ncbi:MAG: LamG-like jellyroll fold domain-containing protein [Bacteroidota bacterium]
MKRSICCWAVVCQLLVQAGIAQGFSLRFFGNGIAAVDQDRVKIRIDDPTMPADPGPPVDVGDTDLTIEFWMKGNAADNTSAAITCGFNYDWINGNIILDRDRFNQERAFGISIAGGVPVFGILDPFFNSQTICGTTNVLDNVWHHIAVQRRLSDGWIWLYVDGMLEAQADGPDGNVSYPDDGVPGNFCGGPCTNSDPFIVLGAEKHDAGAAFPSFNGFMDELRFSDVLRYTANFTPATSAFVTDGSTVGLYHFDEGTGTVIGDQSGASGGPSDGFMNVGGSPSGPIWSSDSPFGSVMSISLEDAHFQPMPTEPSLRAFPQPLESVLHLNIPGSGDKQVALYHYTGQMAWKGVLQAGGQHVLTNLSDLIPGMYVVRITGFPPLTLLKN